MSRQVNTLSLPLAIGVGLLCFVLSFALSSVLPAWEERDRLAAQLAALAQKRESLPPATSAPEVVSQTSTDEQTEPEKLPHGGKLQKLQQLITAQGLSPESIAYRKELNGESAGALYHISVPLKVPYPVLRKFLEKVQTELPGIRLDRLSLQRTRASEQMLDVQLEFVLRIEGTER